MAAPFPLKAANAAPDKGLSCRSVYTPVIDAAVTDDENVLGDASESILQTAKGRRQPGR